MERGDRVGPKACSPPCCRARGSPSTRRKISRRGAILDKAILHLPDYSAMRSARERTGAVQATFEINASLYLPLMREGECIGLLTLTSRRANAFGLSEIAQANPSGIRP